MSGRILPNPKTPGAAVPDSLEDICVAGITPFTTIDFPGRLAGVFYLQGCPWRCRYCYNSEFWPLPPAGQRIPPEKIVDFLRSRAGHLDGIVFSGGEPTVHEHLPLWVRAVRERGFQIGLHTGGMFPGRLGEVLPMCDWVGMDVKAPFEAYEAVTGVSGSGAAARRGAEKILASGVACEFRTTFHPDLLSEKDLEKMARDLASMGCAHYTLQGFRSDHCPDKVLRESAASGVGISVGLRMKLKEYIPDFKIREA